MTYACSYVVPAGPEMYHEVKAKIAQAPTEGLVAHVVFQAERGLQHLEVWESEEAWTTYHEETVEPAVQEILKEAGFTTMPPHPAMTQLDLVDVMLGNGRRTPTG